MSETERNAVHNLWTLYGMNPDGSEAEEKLAALGTRPQDWGDPRWSYHRFQFAWMTAPAQRGAPGALTAHEVHCWTDLKRKPHEYPMLFAAFIVQIYWPGSRPELCGRDYLAPDDFWQKNWGPQPPYFEPNGHDFDDDFDVHLDDIPDTPYITADRTCSECGAAFDLDDGYDAYDFQADDGGVSPGYDFGPPTHWASGTIGCPNCGVRIPIEVSD